MPETPETLVAEGEVVDDQGEPFLETEPPKGNGRTGLYGPQLLEGFKGWRVRVTVEIIT